jgi:DHA2 family multidrug resistance protein
MAKPISGWTLVLLTLSLSLGIFMNVLDISIANVAIPTIAGDLGISPNQGTWVITSFSVTTAIFLPLTGWLSRRFGEVKLFLFSTAAFTLFSVLCGLSSNLTMLVIFRVLQGAVAGPMIPLSQSLLLANYPDDKKGFATSLWAMTAVVAPICGPVIGGGIILRGRDTLTSTPRIDMVGIILLTIGIGSLQILLDQGHDLDWFHSNIIIALTVVSIVALTFLVAWELTDDQPIIDLALFKRRNFAIGTLALSLGFLIYFANVVIFPLWLQTQMNYTPTWAGLAAAPVGLFPILVTPLIGKLINKVDLRILVSIGFFAFALSSFWSSDYTTSVSYVQLIEPRLLQGVGIAFFFTPLISIVISGIPANRIASALGLANFFRILGGSFGTSISVTMWSNREAIHNSQLVEQITHYNPISVDALHALSDVGLTNNSNYEVIARIITNQAYMLATNDLFWLGGYIFIGLFTIIWFTKPPFISSMKSPTVE